MGDALTALAQISVLVAPVQPIRRDKYARYLAAITAFDRIPLRDVPPDSRGQVAPLSAQAQSEGWLMLNYTHQYDRSHAYLEDLQASRKIYGVVGITDASEWGSDLADARTTFKRNIDNLGFIPSATRCYAFDPLDSQDDQVEGLVVVPSVGDINFYIGTLMADFCASILHELSNAFLVLDQKLYIPSPFAAPNAPTMTSNDINDPTKSTRPYSMQLDIESQAHKSMTDLRRSTASPSPSINSDRPLSMTDAGFADKTSKRRMQGRVLKCKADLRVLAGRWTEAHADYAEATQIARLTGDDLWQASAMESGYLLECVQAWSRTLQEQPRAPFSAPRVDLLAMSQQSSAEATNEVLAIKDITRVYIYLNMYAKNLHSNKDTTRPGDATPPLVYAEACLRLTRVLSSVWLNSGWTPAAFHAMCVPSSASKGPPSLAEGSDMTHASNVTRVAIAEAASLANGPGSNELSVLDRLTILKKIASIYHLVGFQRKEAAVLWEIAALMADASRSARRSEIHANEGASNVVKSQPQFTGNSAIAGLFAKACQGMRVDLVKTAVTNTKREASSAIITLPDATVTKESHTGWPSLQVALLSDALFGAQFITTHSSALSFAISALTNYADFMLADIQLQISKSIPTILASAERRGSDLALPYWGPQNLIGGFELVAPLPSMVLYTNNSVSQVPPTPAAESGTKPFIFDPKKARHTAPKLAISSGDTIGVLVTFQNPFTFDMHVSNAELWFVGADGRYELTDSSTSEGSFEGRPLSFVLPAGCLRTVTMIGIAHSLGIIQIKGVKLNLAGSVSQEFLLPTAILKQRESTGEAPSADADAHDLISQEDRLTFLQVAVTSTQPLLRVISTSLEHSAISIFEGESKIIKITLENVSETLADSIQLTLSDNHSTACANTLIDTENDLAPDEAYELDYELQHRPVFSWERTAIDSDSIQPAKSLILAVQCLGKFHCTNGMIQIDYGTSAAPDYVRRLYVPVQISCRRVVTAEAVRFVQVATPLSSRTGRRPSVDAKIPTLAYNGRSSEDAETQTCLMLTVANQSGQAIEAHLECLSNQPEEEATAIEQRLESGATTNIILPIPRINLLEPGQSASEIPLPSVDRQFVVSAKRKRMTEEDKFRERSQFWYRQALLGLLRATWHNPISQRSGELSLREVLHTFAANDSAPHRGVEIEATVSIDGHPLNTRNGRKVCDQGVFLDFTGTVTHSDRTTGRISLSVTVEVAILDEDSHADLTWTLAGDTFISDGANLSRIFDLEAITKPKLSTPLCFLSSGLFKLSMVARSVYKNTTGEHIGNAQIVLRIR